MKIKLIIISIWHAIQVLFGPLVIGISPLILTVIHFSIGAIIGSLNYLLFKKNRTAFVLMLLFLAAQSLSFNFPDFQYEFFYGIKLDIHIFDSPIGFNPVTIIMFFLLLSVRKEYKKKDTEAYNLMERNAE